MTEAQKTPTTVDATVIGEAIRKKALGYAAKTATDLDLAVVRAANAKHEFSLGPIHVGMNRRGPSTTTPISASGKILPSRIASRRKFPSTSRGPMVLQKAHTS